MDTTGNAEGVMVVGNYAYVADYASGLAIIDITDKANPGTPVYMDTTGTAIDVRVVGNYAYVADYYSGLAIIDISDPTNPGTPVYKDTSGYASGVTVVGNYAYVADDSSGLAIIDISDPTNPGTPVYKDTDGRAWGVTVVGNYAYVADDSSGLAIIDISDPTNPGSPVYRDTSGRASNVTVVGNYAYVADYAPGLAIIDVSDPTSPGTPVYRAFKLHNAYGVTVVGNYVYVGNSASGLAVIPLNTALIQDAAGNNATLTLASPGATNSLGANKAIVIDTTNAPVATAQSVTTQEDTAKEITHVGTDADEDTLSFIIVTLPTNGTLKDGDTQISSEDLPKTLSSAKVTYTPNSDYNGDDSYTFKVNDGTKDSEKATISITVTSNDLDDDGVKNPVDKCPDTPAGAQVDFDGCQVFSLPTDNNKVSVTSATCIGTSDGSIGLSVENASYDYTITVTNNDNVTITGDSKTGSVTGLAAGTYTVCFKVDSQASYEQCFDVVIGEPAALSAYLDIDNDNRTTSIQLGGSSNYNIDINGTKYDVSGDSFIATLPTGLSIIKISTDLDCQGVIEREVFLSEDILYYPNPTQDDVNVHVDGQDTKVTVSVFSEKGSLLYREEQEIKDMSRLTQIDLSKQITGTYIVVMEGTTVRKTFKIVKR
jgi:hypothetical protein